MNRTTLRILLAVLVMTGLMLTASSCSGEKGETAPATEAAEVMATAAPQTTALQTTAATEPSKTLPPETQAPTTQPTETEPPEERFLLTFAGDCTLGCVPEAYYATVGFIKTVGDDYEYPFRNVIDYFENDEFSMVNLEGTLTKDGARQNKSFTFIGPPDYVNILTENSVEAVTVANNHTWDFGELGYKTTLETLDGAGVPYVRQNNTQIVTTQNGLTIGLYATVYYAMDTEDMVESVQGLKEQGVDLVVVAPHWGGEGFYTPDKSQTEYAYAAIGAGADIVYGAHPHVLQPVEEYNGGIIYYSLGNFVFGGNSNPEDYDTAIFQQEIIRDAEGNVRLGELKVIPCSVSSASSYNNYQPTPYEEGSEEYNRVLAKVGGNW